MKNGGNKYHLLPSYLPATVTPGKSLFLSALCYLSVHFLKDLDQNRRSHWIMSSAPNHHLSLRMPRTQCWSHTVSGPWNYRYQSPWFSIQYSRSIGKNLKLSLIQPSTDCPTLDLAVAGRLCPSVLELSAVIICPGTDTPYPWRSCCHLPCSVNAVARPHTPSASAPGLGLPLLVSDYSDGNVTLDISPYESVWKP